MVIHNAFYLYTQTYFWVFNRKNVGLDFIHQELIKGLLHPKMKILSLITYPHVVANPVKS